MFSRFEKSKSKSKPSLLRRDEGGEAAQEPLRATPSEPLSLRREPAKLGGGSNRRFDFKRKSWFSLS